MPRASSQVLRDPRGEDSLVAIDRFVLATRDSGYKGTASAVAELVDNALQAGGTRIVIRVEHEEGGEGLTLSVSTTDAVWTPVRLDKHFGSEAAADSTTGAVSVDMAWAFRTVR